MVTKKTSTAKNKKTTKSSPAKVSAKKTSKAVAKKSSKSASMSRAPKAKPAKKVEPFHPAFGLVLLLACCIIAAFLIAGLAFYIIKCNETDASRFASEYSLVGEDNVYVYKTGKEAIDVIENGTGIVFLGFPSCPWCQNYAMLLNNLAKEYGIKTIYYHDTYDDWKNDTEEYKKLTSLLSERLQYDNVGNHHLYVPNVTFVVNGEIVGNDWETSKDHLDAETPEEYWTEERISAWKEKVSPYFEKVKESVSE
ncbi:hypothetical protein IKG02_03155 [Candidatus Saccharibacteria bacterium]|nr:hypothetical protein [Candidatus Saccharibacteria bacterium]